MTMPSIKNNSIHIHSLTGLRFFAALMVLLMHFSDFIPMPFYLLPVIKAGGIGVSFFFVLSGFLLYHRYGEIFEQRLRKKDLKNFFLARIFRIYPAYVSGLILVTVVKIFFDRYFYPDPGLLQAKIGGWLINFFALQTFSSNIFTLQFWNAPSWSVSTEFFFYFSFPFFLYFFSRELKTKFQILLSIALFFCLCLLLRLLVVFGAFAGWFDKTLWIDYISDRNFLWRFWEFAIGVMTSKLMICNDFGLSKSIFRRNTTLIFAFFITLFIAYIPWPQEEMSNLLARVTRLGILNTLPFAIIISCFWAGSNFLSKLMENKFIVYLGECSYAIYIYHWSFWVISENLVRAKIENHQVLLFSCFGMIGSIVLAMVSFSFYENPTRKWATEKFIKKNIF